MGYLERIRALREDRDLPQKAVAACLSCDPSLHSKYERDIPPSAVCRLADHCQSSVDDLAGHTDDPRPYPPAGRDRE